MIKKGEKYAKWLIVLGVGISILTTLLFLFWTGGKFNPSNSINTSLFDHYGSFVGGIVGILFSLSGVFLLIETLNDQRESISKQQIESRFYELLKIHRENGAEMKVGESVGGREIFKFFVKEFYLCYGVVMDVAKNKAKELTLEQKINAAYISFYFGAVGLHSSQVVKKHLEDSYKNDFIETLLTTFAKKRNVLEKDANIPYQLFDGHQVRLGHYYRHLFQTVRYINQQNILSYRDKYEYIKTLRAQFSTHEQILLFFNSLSELGQAWEKKHKGTIDNELITKYNLLKNIPKGNVSITNIKDFYPNIKFEGEKVNSEIKENLIRKYR